MKVDFDRFGAASINPETFENPYLFINWNLGNSCTYACSYCAKECHDGSFAWPTVEEAIKTVQTLDRVYKSNPFNKKLLIFEILGGEVTIWKNFEVIVDAIRKTGNKVMLVTNGVRNLAWWEANAEHFDHVTLSYHPEHADYKHIASVANLLFKKNVSASILVLMYSEVWDTCLKAHAHFKRMCRVPIDLQKLTVFPSSKFGKTLGEVPAGDQRWLYTEAQLAYLKKKQTYRRKGTWYWPFGVIKQKFFSINYLSSQKNAPVWDVSPAFLNTNNLNQWTGWDCYVGIDTLFLEQNGDIKRSVMCGVSAPLGSWRYVKHLDKYENMDQVKWPTSAVVCPHTRCFCSHDYRARKQRNQSPPKVSF